VKDGAIIPLLADASNAEADQALEVRHYGKQANTYVLYNDDGLSYDYEHGAYSLTELSAKAGKNGTWSGSERALGSDAFGYDRISWRWMTE